MKRFFGGFAVLLLLAGCLSPARAATQSSTPCARPGAGSVVAEPTDLYATNGVLQVAFDYYTSVDAAGRTLFCFVTTPGGVESPTLHLHRGDTLALTVTNLNPTPPAGSPNEIVDSGSDTCGAAVMTITSVNVHFHGTNTSPKCHADEVIHTLINSGQTFKYTVKFPANEPTGLYWYHPHVHPIAEAAVQGGASGAIVIDGVENFQPAVAGLPARVLLVRDQTIPGGPTPGGRVPSWDLSLNYVPISYPQNTPAVIEMKPGGKEFWRVVNASADTILDVRLVYDGVVQPVQVVALDGVPLSSQDGTRQGKLVTMKSIELAPAARAEFIVIGPASGVGEAIFETRTVSTGIGGTDPKRPLARIVTTASPRPPLPVIPSAAEAPYVQRFTGLAAAKVTTERFLAFSEGGGEFFIGKDGFPGVAYSPNEPPLFTTTQGAVEDWTIFNQTPETHSFHIHQTHFLLLQRDGITVHPAQQQFLDTIDVPRGENVKVRIDFRGMDIGDFVFHCHILEHEDHGMMAIIRVLPKP
jgi:FtsP/CotA-like multicopper oxidase with cupredoxin domain